MVRLPVADPGFPRGEGANPQGGCQDMILLKFPENCMKLKKIRSPGGGGTRPLHPPLDPLLITHCQVDHGNF